MNSVVTVVIVAPKFILESLKRHGSCVGEAAAILVLNLVMPVLPLCRLIIPAVVVDEQRLDALVRDLQASRVPAAKIGGELGARGHDQESFVGVDGEGPCSAQFAQKDLWVQRLLRVGF